MFAYVIMYIVVVVAFLNKEKRFLGEIAFFTLLFFSLFRGELVGIDTYNAMKWSTIVNRATMDFDWTVTRTYEISTNYIYQLIYYNGFSPRIIIIFYSIITFLSLRLSSKRFNVDIATMMLIFIVGGAYIYSFNVARQFASLGLVLYAITYIYENERLKSLIFFPVILFAISIHTSSIIFLPFYVFRYIKLKRNIVLGVLFTVIIGNVIGFFDFKYLINDILSLETMEAYDDAYGEGLSEVYQRSLFGYLVMYIALLFQLYTLLRQYALKYTVLVACCISLVVLFGDLDGPLARLFFGAKLIVLVYMGYYLSNYKDIIFKCLFLIMYSYLFFRGLMDPYYFCF